MKPYQNPEVWFQAFETVNKAHFQMFLEHHKLLFKLWGLKA